MVYSKTASLRGETEADAEHVQQVCGLCNDLADDPVVSYQSPYIFVLTLGFLSAQYISFLPFLFWDYCGPEKVLTNIHL